MTDRTLLDRAGLARRLNISVEKLYQKLPSLIATGGFPPPVWGNMRGARWDPVAIDLWLDAKLPRAANANTDATPASAHTNPSAEADILDTRAAMLSRRR